MNNICQALTYFNEKLQYKAVLVAVSKTKPVSDIELAYNCGQRHFGENYVQELVDKEALLPKDISWHMLGHLQRNKVKFIAPFVHLIHGVDTEKLLQTIDKEALKCKRVIDCLLQVHISQEETKFGFSYSELRDFLASGRAQEFKNVRIIGLMAMASFTDNTGLIKQEFEGLETFYNDIKANYRGSNLSWHECTIGMTADYEIAIKHGATLVRIGTAIFGSRNYAK